MPRVSISGEFNLCEYDLTKRRHAGTPTRLPSRLRPDFCSKPQSTPEQRFDYASRAVLIPVYSGMIYLSLATSAHLS